MIRNKSKIINLILTLVVIFINMWNKKFIEKVKEMQWSHLFPSLNGVMLGFVKVGKAFLKSHSIQRLFQPLWLEISIAYIIPFNSAENALVWPRRPRVIDWSTIKLSFYPTQNMSSLNYFNNIMSLWRPNDHFEGFNHNESLIEHLSFWEEWLSDKLTLVLT